MKQLTDEVFAQVREALAMNRVMGRDADGNYTRECTPKKITAAIAALDTAQPVQVSQTLLKALSALLTHSGMDEDEWSKPTFDQARAAIKLATTKTQECGMCGYVGTEADAVGQCPRCHWDELRPTAAKQAQPEQVNAMLVEALQAAEKLEHEALVALSEATDELIARLRSFETDHKPDGWPAIQMRDVSALLDAIEALEAEVEAVKKSEIERLLRIETKVDELVTERDALQAQLAAAQTEVERLNIYNSHLRGYNSRLQSKQMVVTDVAAIPQQPAQPVLRVIPTAQGVFPVWFDGAWRKSVYKYGTDYGTGIALYAAPIPQQVAEPEQLTDSYVQTVPDKCDRIVWRNKYYHLPLKESK